MMALRSPGRLATAVGLAVAAVGATVMAVTAAHAAPEPGRCIDNVNVRAEAKPDARITGLCRTGTRVTVEERSAGFVRLKEFTTRDPRTGREVPGWASERYVEAGTPRGGPSTSSTAATPRRGPERPASSPTATTTPAAGPGRSDDVDVEEESPPPSSQAPAPPGPLGGLLG